MHICKTYQRIIYAKLIGVLFKMSVSFVHMLTSFVSIYTKFTSILNNMLVSFVYIDAKLTSIFNNTLVSFWIKKMNKSNNDHVGPIIYAILSFYSLFSYASRIASKKMCPINTSLYFVCLVSEFNGAFIVFHFIFNYKMRLILM